MPDSSRLIKRFSKGGRLDRKPAGYSYLSRKLNPQEKLKIIRYLSGCRESLLEDLGGESNLSAQKLILVDRCVSLLSVLRGIEMFFEEDIMSKTGELAPALGKNYISYVNATRQILCALGLERKTERVLSPLEYIKQLDQGKKSPEKSTNTSGDGHE